VIIIPRLPVSPLIPIRLVHTRASQIAALLLWCAFSTWLLSGNDLSAVMLLLVGAVILWRARAAPEGRLGAVRVRPWHLVIVLGLPALTMPTLSGFATVAVVIATFVVVAQVLEDARRHRLQLLRELRLQADLARVELERGEAELRALRMQLQPDFLFDTLHSAAALLHTAPRAAEKMVLRLTDVLRRVLSGTPRADVSLEEEIETAKPFLEIELLRMSGLRIDWDVDRNALDAIVPHMILQPLAHGALRGTGRHLLITVRGSGGSLEIEAAGDGKGGGEVAADDAELRDRLARLYGDRFELEMAGGRTRLRIPWEAEALPRAPLRGNAEPEKAPAGAHPLLWVAFLAMYAVVVWGEYEDVVGTRKASGRVVTPLQAFGCLFLTGSALIHLFYRAFRAGVERRAVGARWREVLRAHALPGAGAALALLAADVVSRGVLRGWNNVVPSKQVPVLLFSLALYVLLYAATAAVADALEYRRQRAERPLIELRLQTRLARAELERTSAELRALKLQLNPHFLFNALNAALTLARTSPAAAKQVILRLVDLLRQAITRAGVEEVTLAGEIETLKPFLDIESLRLQGRLRVEWDVAEEALSARVPHMLLQPLAENAVKHGIAPAAQAGLLRIAARRSGEWLELEIHDDGAGVRKGAERQAGTGIGMANTRARLEQLYGDRFSLELVPGPERGTIARLRLPWHQTPRTEP
jgi:LytS/YehU family sensor histidine kinase